MEGYAKLASLMGAHPEVAILRRFGALNAQNLLYLQAELVALESDLQKFSLEERTSNDPHREFNSRDWYSLSMSEENIDNNESTGRQWRCALMIRDRLKEYNEALLQQTTLASLRSPNPRDLAFLQEWMIRPTMGNVYLLGRDSDIWSIPDISDLIALNSRHADDPFTAWVANKAVHWWHRVAGKHLRVLALTIWEYDLLTIRRNQAQQTGRLTQSLTPKVVYSV
ncbi:MAG: hypothetical protein Q9161_004824 [Pseudevernia consocians]